MFLLVLLIYGLPIAAMAVVSAMIAFGWRATGRFLRLGRIACPFIAPAGVFAAGMAMQAAHDPAELSYRPEAALIVAAFLAVPVCRFVTGRILGMADDD